jgi:hypothetical protein
MQHFVSIAPVDGLVMLDQVTHDAASILFAGKCSMSVMWNLLSRA